MQEPSSQPAPVRAALEDVANTGRTLVLKRLDLLQLEAERMVEDAASRVSGAVGAIMMAAMALLTGSVALIAWGTPTYGLDGAAGLVTVGYAVLAALFAFVAKRRRQRSLFEGQ